MTQGEAMKPHPVPVLAGICNAYRRPLTGKCNNQLSPDPSGNLDAIRLCRCPVSPDAFL